MGGFRVNGCGVSDRYYKIMELGYFDCPSCKKHSLFTLDEVKRKVDIFFIPTVAVSQKYAVMCKGCGNGWYIEEGDKNDIMSGKKRVVITKEGAGFISNEVKPENELPEKIVEVKKEEPVKAAEVKKEEPVKVTEKEEKPIENKSEKQTEKPAVQNTEDKEAPVAENIAESAKSFTFGALKWKMCPLCMMTYSEDKTVCPICQKPLVDKK